MKIHSVYDAEFKPYGQVLEGYDTQELREAMMKIDLPEGVNYEPGIDSLEACASGNPDPCAWNQEDARWLWYTEQVGDETVLYAKDDALLANLFVA